MAAPLDMTAVQSLYASAVNVVRVIIVWAIPAIIIAIVTFIVYRITTFKRPVLILRNVGGKTVGYFDKEGIRKQFWGGQVIRKLLKSKVNKEIRAAEDAYEMLPLEISKIKKKEKEEDKKDTKDEYEIIPTGRKSELRIVAMHSNEFFPIKIDLNEEECKLHAIPADLVNFRLEKMRATVARWSTQSKLEKVLNIIAPIAWGILVLVMLIFFRDSINNAINLGQNVIETAMTRCVAAPMPASIPPG